MNPLRDMILNEIVRPEVREATKVHLGTIEVFDASSSTADIRLGANGDESYKDVPFARGPSYVYGTEPRPGTPVIVSFVKGDRNYPYIISILNDDITDLTTGKRRMVPDIAMGHSSIRRVGGPQY